ncbi:MAG: sensor histidine kinase [Planctomycetota bacterium]|jgi:two-component system sensor histidine kinase QseC
MKTIRGRLLAMLLTGLTVVLTAGGAAVYWIAQSSLMRQLDAGLRTRAMALASLVTFDDGRIEFEFDEGKTGTIEEGYFEFQTRSGDVLRRSANLAEASLPMRPGLDRGFAFDDIELPGQIEGRAVWLAFRPRLDWEAGGGSEPEELVVAAALDREPVDRALATLLGALIAVGVVVGITVGVLVSFGVRWGLAPLGRLSRQLGSVSGRTISKRVDAAGAPGELVPIYRELNSMLDRVERALERERSFANAAAHELRTPLAELRATAEVAIRWPDTGRATASLREMLSIGREMEHLVESLLLIIRGNAAGAESEADEVSVAPIVHECLQRANGSIIDKGLKLTVDLDERNSLRAPPDAVEIMVRNLIDNAVRYTPSEGRVTIRNECAADGSPSLIVENDPVELEEDDLPRLFEPFWRAEGSRSDREHVGLGMAVVTQVAQAIGLRVDAGLAGDRLQIRVSGAA